MRNLRDSLVRAKITAEIGVTTPPTNLHDTLRAEVERRLAVAGAATPGEWRANHYGVESEVWSPELHRVVGRPTFEVLQSYVTSGRNTHASADAAHIALHDPADAIRRYAGELEVLERHVPNEDRECRTCLYCSGSTYQDDPIAKREDWPCPEILSLASRLGVSVDG